MATQSKQPIGSKPENPSPIIERVTNSLRITAEEIVPWFIEQMPLMYFQDTDEETQLAHLRAIIAEKASGRPIELTLRSDDASEWTFMRPRDYPGVLAELMEDLPWDQPLRAAKIHTAGDGVEAIEKIERSAPDLLILDVMMPRMSGFEVCQKIKSQPSTRDIVEQFLEHCWLHFGSQNGIKQL